MSQAITRAPQATGIFTSPYKFATLCTMRINSLRNSEFLSVRSFSLSQYLRSKMIVDAKSKSFSLLKLYTLDNMLANSSKSSVPRQAFNRVLRSIRPPLLGPRIEFRFVISKNADLNVNQPVRRLRWFGTSLQVGCGVGGSRPSRSLRERAATRQRFHTSPAQHCPQQPLKQTAPSRNALERKSRCCLGI